MVEVNISEITETVVKTGGRNYPSYVFTWYTPDGKRKRVYSSSLEKLKAKREQKYLELVRGEQQKSKVLWDDFAVDFLAYRAKQVGLNINSRSYDNDERHLRLHLNQHFKGKRLADIKVVDVNMMLVDFAAKGIAPKTQRHIINTGLRLMRHAIACELVANNPFEGDARERVVGANGTRSGYRPEEVEAILKTEKHLMYRALWYIAAFTGLSASELAGLQWTDIDIEKAQITVNRSAIRYAYNEDAKTEFRKRTLPLPPRTLNWVREWKVSCPNRTIAFPSVVNGIGSQDTWRKHLKYTCRKADVPYKGIGGFRNFFCTSMENAGVPNAIRNYRMGHSKKSHTADIHYTDVDLRRATSAEDAVALEAAFAP